MPSSRQRITVIGTGCFGASIGLAIRRSKDAEHLEIVGHDREHGIARQAKKLGASDDVHFNLDMALRGAQAVVTVHNLALTLGATPLYMNPVEHDAVRAMASTLPALLSTVLFDAISETPGWPELRRAAGREFATATSGASGDAPSLRMAALLGRETVLAGLDEVLAQLQSLRLMVAESDGEGLDTRLSGAVAGRARWMLETQTRAWQMTAETVGQGGLLERTLHMMFGEGLTKKPERSQRPS